MSSRRRASYRRTISTTVAAVSALGVLMMGVSTLLLLQYVLPQVPLSRTVIAFSESAIIEVGEPQLYVPYDMLVPVVSIVLALSLVVVVAGTSVSAWFIAGRIIRPLTSIGDVARRATAGDLSARVHLDGPDDEVGRVADAIDTMLDDLQRSLDAHRRFAANASHELTTPLAIAQALIDVELARADPIDRETERALVTLRSVNRRSIETVEALLDLAEAGRAGHDRVPVDVGVIARDVAHHLDSVASDRRVTVTVTTPAHVVAWGDRVLLRQAIDNLVTNAIRHNVPGGTVSLDVEARDTTIAVTVANSGAVVEAESVATWREPFVRAAARVSQPGRGLGLALVDAIAVSHHGMLELTPRDGGGLVARLTVPRHLGAGSPASDE